MRVVNIEFFLPKQANLGKKSGLLISCYLNGDCYFDNYKEAMLSNTINYIKMLSFGN
jgi:hypothetical protein